MRRKVLCITLALLMCMMVTMPTFAEDEAETLPERASIAVTFGLTHVSGSTYNMWAKIINPQSASVTAALFLFNSSYIPVASVGTTSTNVFINFGKNVTLSSGTYHLRITYMADGQTYSIQKTYMI